MLTFAPAIGSQSPHAATGMGGGLRLKGNRVRSPDSPAAVNIFFCNEGHECHRGRTGKLLKGH